MALGWFVSAVLSGLVNKSLEYFKNQTGLEDEVEKLKLCIPKIESVVCEAEKRQIAENPGLKEWLWNLKVALFEAEDVLDELEYSRIEKEATSSNNIVYPNRLKAVVEELSKIGNDSVSFLTLVEMEQSLISSVRSSHNDQRSRGPCLTKQTPIFGREEERKELINQLLCFQSSTTDGVSVIPIVGEGGVGKTTLAQLVCNDDKVKQHFKPENIWWVTVSDDFVLDLLAKKIYNAVFKYEPSGNDFDFIQAELKTKLESKTFLLVLDDVWDDMKSASWSQVISLLEHGKHGSKILVTTRLEDVVRMVKTTSDPIRLTRLKEEAYWELFKEVCLPDPEDQAKHPELLEIGKTIAKKLNGSLLAAKVVGGMLNDELDERYWNSIYQTDMHNFDDKDIMSVLKMSYQHLPTYLQPLFRYCSIFPPDHFFDKEQLIYMWVGAGLILQEKDQEQDLEDLGSCYFEDLLRRSFFITTEEISNRYVMHDLLHELARDVSAGECCRVSGDRLLDIPIPITTQHLSVETAELLENKHFFEKMSQLKHLRTLRFRFYYKWDSRAEDEALFNKLFETLTSIRVLDLPEYHDMEIWINKLIHLRYLDAKVSIASLSRLHLLQFLIFPGPTKMSAEHLFLPHLRHFTNGLDYFPELDAPRNLTMLRELNICLKKERGYKISELCNLVELRYLRIKALENVSGSEEAGAANMKEKHHLKELNLKWNPYSNDELRTSEAVFDGLEPHVDLKIMAVTGYPGSRGPCWFQTYSFKSKLEKFCIENCSNWKDMSFLQLFPKLRILEVSSCLMLKTLPPLPLGLKILKLNGLMSLKTLPEWTILDNETSWLSELFIRNCPNLISLKEGLLQENVKLKHLKEVEIVNCPKLVYLPDLLPTSLSEIVLSDCSSITSLDLSGLTALETLRITSCRALERIGQLFPKLRALEVSSCPMLKTLPPLPLGLKVLKLHFLSSLTTLPEWTVQDNETSWLSELFIRNCPNLISLKEGLLQENVKLKYLKIVEIRYCPKLVHLPDLLPTSLSDINLRDCSSITSLDLFGLTALEILRIYGCHALKSVNLQGTLGIRDLLPTSLSYIVLTQCSRITSLDLSGLTALKTVVISHCRKLESVEGLENLASLTLVNIYECPRLPRNRTLQQNEHMIHSPAHINENF